MANAYSMIEHIARSTWVSQFRWDNRMAMYSAYFDESGHPTDNSFLVVGGCVADVDQWVHFEREWRLALQPLGIEIFHATDFHNRSKPYDRLTDQEARDLFRALVGILCRRIEHSVASVVPLADYNAINRHHLIAEMWGHPYPSACRSCLAMIEEWTEKHSLDYKQIQMFFESGARNQGQVEWICNRDKLRTRFFKQRMR